jgi:hypothetical protein
MMGGALGLAVLASLAAAQTSRAVASGLSDPAALNSGYHLAFGVGAAFVILAAVLGLVLFRRVAAPAAMPASGHSL